MGAYVLLLLSTVVWFDTATAKLSAYALGYEAYADSIKGVVTIHLSIAAWSETDAAKLLAYASG